MNDTTNPEDVAARARAIIERDVDMRVEAVRVVADAAIKFDAAELRVKDATAVHERAWTAALSAGWSEKELRAAGVRAPGTIAPKVRRARSTPVTQKPNTEQ
jgi:hypothetical protein